MNHNALLLKNGCNYVRWLWRWTQYRNGHVFPDYRTPEQRGQGAILDFRLSALRREMSRRQG